MSSTHSPHLLFSPKKKSNNNENNHSFSYEVISTLESTGVHFRTSIDPGSYVPAHLHHAIEIIYLSVKTINNISVLRKLQMLPICNPAIFAVSLKNVWELPFWNIRTN